MSAPVSRAASRSSTEIDDGDLGAHEMRAAFGSNGFTACGEIGLQIDKRYFVSGVPYSRMPELKASLEISTISEDCNVTLERLFSS